jgi:hypothetical protein
MSKKDNILTLYKESFLKEAEIGAKLGCSQQYVSKVLNEVGRTKLNDERVKNYKDKLFNMLVEKIETLHASIESQDFLIELKGIERLAKLFALDAAQELNISVELPTKAEYIIDVDPQDKSS